MGQEGREVQTMFSMEDVQIDYITFQPYAEYYETIEMLKENKAMSFRLHYSALSDLSRMILRYTGIMLLLVFLLIGQRFIVVCGYLFQIICLCGASSVFSFAHGNVFLFEL